MDEPPLRIGDTVVFKSPVARAHFPNVPLRWHRVVGAQLTQCDEYVVRLANDDRLYPWSTFSKVSVLDQLARAAS